MQYIDGVVLVLVLEQSAIVQKLHQTVSDEWSQEPPGIIGWATSDCGSLLSQQCSITNRCEPVVDMGAFHRGASN